LKKFNLFIEIVVAKRGDLQEAINSSKHFGIDIEGKVCYEPFTIHDILIYKGMPDSVTPIELAFGKNYQVVLDNERVLIKAFSNWQEITTLLQTVLMNFVQKRWKVSAGMPLSLELHTEL
jgi:hypothetical protein